MLRFSDAWSSLPKFMNLELWEAFFFLPLRGCQHLKPTRAVLKDLVSVIDMNDQLPAGF